MYFILSKLLLFLIYPFLWVCALLVIAIFSKNSRRKQRLLLAAIIVLYVFSCPFLLNSFANAWSVKDESGPATKTYSCAIVLGGFTTFGKNGDGYFNWAADRFIQGVKLLKTGRVNHLMITGGNGNIITHGHYEGDWASGQLKALKIPDSCVLVEDRSRNTIENAVFSKRILEKSGLKPPYLLVTSDFHMRRSLMIFKKAGYDVLPYPCNFTDGKNPFGLNDFAPDAETLGGWDIYLKEVVGYVVDGFKKY
jgi:uncharacterized SAM-binding protein YcdF (DUF218 family)